MRSGAGQVSDGAAIARALEGTGTPRADSYEGRLKLRPSGPGREDREVLEFQLTTIAGELMNRMSPNVLIDTLSSEGSMARDALWVLGFSLLTALMAQIEIPLPYTPVPLTGQTFAVLLSGAVLGCRRGLLSQAAYLAAGAAGMPVFAGGGSTALRLLGPTGGYLWSFPIAAGLLGWLVERGAGRRAWKMAVSLVACDVLILACGAFWLHSLFGVAHRHAWLLGFYPFLVGDFLKVCLVGITLPRLLRRERPPAQEAR
jgi:biotin transport system substrate-specific component